MRASTVAAASLWLLIAVVAGCAEPAEEVALPDPATVEVWFEGAATVHLAERRLQIEAVMQPEHLAKGGVLWQRATPFFYLFNVHVRQVLLDYPALEGVDVSVRGENEEPLASVSLDRGTLSVYEWDRAIAYTSRAQREGTEQPRFVADLLRWAEDRVENSYVRQ